MRTIAVLMFAELIALFGGCYFHEDSAGEQSDCLTAFASFHIIVTDDHGTPICDGKVRAREVAFEQMLTADTSRCNWYAVPDREGSYEVIVEAPGYQAVATYVSVGDFYGCSGPENVMVVLKSQ
jgi:hypothetical protein